MVDKNMVLTPKQIKFQNRVIAWRTMAEIHGGWGKAATYFGLKKPELLKFILDDLETIWGSKLKWDTIL